MYSKLRVDMLKAIKAEVETLSNLLTPTWNSKEDEKQREGCVRDSMAAITKAVADTITIHEETRLHLVHVELQQLKLTDKGELQIQVNTGGKEMNLVNASRMRHQDCVLYSIQPDLWDEAAEKTGDEGLFPENDSKSDKAQGGEDGQAGTGNEPQGAEDPSGEAGANEAEEAQAEPVDAGKQEEIDQAAKSTVRDIRGKKGK
jgi:hypothetical protein